MKKARVIACVLVVLLTFSLIGTAAATNGSKMAELFYRDIKVTLNGKTVNTQASEPFIIDGTTYLPVRAVSEALGLDVKWDSATSTVVLSEPVEAPPAGEFHEPTVLSQLEVTDYICYGDWTNYGIFEIKNNSAYDVSVTVSAKFYNASGTLVAAETGGATFSRGGQGVVFFLRDEEISRMEYDLIVSEDDDRYSESAAPYLSYEYVSAPNKAIVSVTNTGSKTAEFVQGHAMFFKGDKVVGFDWGYFVDADSEIKPGKTISEELYCSRDFDSVKLFFSGSIYN